MRLIFRVIHLSFTVFDEDNIFRIMRLSIEKKPGNISFYLVHLDKVT